MTLYLKEKEPLPLNQAEVRIVFDFGFENRALQQLVLPALKAQADDLIHPNQYLMRGTQAAIKRVADLIREGYAWAIELDIDDCYPSFDGQKVADLLPLPEQVTRSVLLGQYLNLRINPDLSFESGDSTSFNSASHLSPGHLSTLTHLSTSHQSTPSNHPTSHLLQETNNSFSLADSGVDEFMFATEFAVARRGLPQGSATSPLVVEMLLAPVLASLPCEDWVGYADNLLTLGKSKGDVVSIFTACGSAVTAHPAGPLRLNPPKVYKPGTPIDFLGHRLRCFGGQIRIEPTPDNLAKFKTKLQRGLKQVKKGNNKAAERLRKYVLGWVAAFKQCTDIPQIRAAALSQIAKAVK